MIATFLGAWGERLKDLVSRWTAFTAFGSFVLYLLGYLALRFHLTALGIGTDMAVLDERYLFTGARFLVYCASAIPIALILAALAAAVLLVLVRAFPGTIRSRLRAWLARMLRDPARVAVAGIVLSVVLIQLVMRQCFFVGNVLLGPERPNAPGWLIYLLRTPDLMPIFFSARLAGTGLTVGALVAAARARDINPTARTARATGWLNLLAVLVAIQALLLPVNFGLLIVDKALPRVEGVGEPAIAGRQAWLVWEGKEGMTYFVRRADGSRALLTVPRKESKPIEITAYDSWMSVLSQTKEGGAP